MKLVSAAEALFSVKCFAAAMLALYIAMRIGLPRPYWAMTTAYIVAAPFSGPTRSKGLYRAVGTIVGALAALVLVPPLSNAPELLALALALWIGACLYVSLLDRTPRSYTFMLAGYTAGLVAFPAVGAPAHIFDIALARVEEIVLGIGCATLVHSLVFPQSLGPVILARLDHALQDARHWIGDALRPAPDRRNAQDRRQLAADITELRLMATHLPFDTSHLRWTANAIHALQERLAAMMPLLSAIEDRLAALCALGDGAAVARWGALLHELTAWSAERDADPAAARAAGLRAAIAAHAPALGRAASWRDLIEVNLAARLCALVDVCAECRALRLHIDAGVHGSLPEAARRQGGTRALHLDRGLALISAAAAAIGTLVCCAFWILTGWPSGAAAPMMAAILCCFFATQDDPVPFIKVFLMYTIYAIPLCALYLLVLLPAVHSFEMLMLVCAPTFLVMGVLIARPSTYPRAMPFLFAFAATLAMQDTNNANLVSFLNSTLAQVFGLTVAAVCTGVFRTVSAGWTARRLLNAGWTEMARLGNGELTATVFEFSARMVDRIALLTPRLALAGAGDDLQAADALLDLRVGLNMVQLAESKAGLGRSQAALGPLMAHLARHFAARPALDPARQRRLLRALDNALRSVCADGAASAQRVVAAALTSIRRDLFPHAPAYRASPLPAPELP